MTDTSTAVRLIRPRREIKLTVRYSAAARPFKDNNAAIDETVADLKRRVLRAFGLSDGGDPTVYRLFHDRTMLDNEAITLGEIEGGEGDADRELVLRLAQQVTQG
jgi:hypothetical protein